jgi:hypothetical protein
MLSLLRTAGVGERWSRATSSKARAMSHSGASLPETNGMIASTQPIKTSEHQRSLHVVIVTYNSATTAPRCVESLLRSEEITEMRITIVDNASGDGCKEVLAQMFPNIEIIAND